MDRRQLFTRCVRAGMGVGASAWLPARAQVPDAAQTAGLQPATMGWLQQMDAGDHAGTWSNAATAFKSALSAVQWQQAVNAARTPLGAVRVRKERSTRFTRSLPGAPDGQYAVLLFDTEFEHRAQAVETLTAVLEADGVWRVTGYFIR